MLLSYVVTSCCILWCSKFLSYCIRLYVGYHDAFILSLLRKDAHELLFFHATIRPTQNTQGVVDGWSSTTHPSSPTMVRATWCDCPCVTATRESSSTSICITSGCDRSYPSHMAPSRWPKSLAGTRKTTTCEMYSIYWWWCVCVYDKKQSTYFL